MAPTPRDTHDHHRGLHIIMGSSPTKLDLSWAAAASAISQEDIGIII